MCRVKYKCNIWEKEMNNKGKIFFYDLNASGIVDKFRRGPKVSDALKFLYKNSNGLDLYQEGDGRSFFVKETDIKTGVTAIASSRLYGHIGIATPPVSFVAKKDKYTMQTIQQNVEGAGGLETILADDDVEFRKIQTQAFGKYKWQLFYDERLMATLLKFMTPDCFAQFQNMYLVDEMRTDGDKHLKNYFFYKDKESDRYQGIIAVDLDLMQIYNYCGSKKSDFANFLVYPYQTALPQQMCDYVAYRQRVEDIRQLVRDNVLSDSNVNTITSTIEFDYPKEVSNVCKEAKVGLGERKEIIKPVERLWEYNRETLGKDLGL